MCRHAQAWRLSLKPPTNQPPQSHSEKVSQEEKGRVAEKGGAGLTGSRRMDREGKGREGER